MNIITCSFQYIFLILLEWITGSFSNMFPYFSDNIFTTSLWPRCNTPLHTDPIYHKIQHTNFFFPRNHLSWSSVSFPVWTGSSSLIHNSYLCVSPYPFPGNFLSLTPGWNFCILDVISFFAWLTHFERHIFLITGFFRKRTKLVCLLVCLSVCVCKVMTSYWYSMYI